MKVFAAIALAAGAVVLSAASSQAGTGREAPYDHRGFASRMTHATRLAAATRATARGFNCVSSCSSYESTINQYFTDVAADSGKTTNVNSVLTQYSSIQYSSTFGGSYVDGSPYPTTKTCNDGYDTYCVTDKQLQTEIGKVIAANGWPTQSKTTTLYFIFTPANVGVCQHAGDADIFTNACTVNAFCAYHGATDSFVYVVEPDEDAVSDGACDTRQTPAGNGADSTLNTVSHETIEAITDPFGDGWWSEDPDYFGSEIGDLCAWNFGTDLGTTPDGQSYNQVINGHDYYLQQEWSNADGGCVQYAGGPVTNFDSLNPLYAGTGPLVGTGPDHGGQVMTSTDVYAIYWVPAAPVNSRPPTIAGIPKVGKKLRALHGAWSNSPTFAYRWLRCSPAGRSCKGITKAKDSTYMLVKADTRHRIEVRVTASNAGGRANAASAPTRKVRP